MPQSKKKRIEKLTEKTPSSKAIDREQRGTRAGYFIAGSVFVIVILIIVGIFYYQGYVAPFQRTIITIDDTDITMDYFIQKARLTGIDPMYLLESVTNEQLIKQEAPRYIGEVGPEDIEQELRRAARGQSENMTEGEFKEWYRQQLNESKLSDAEYKEMIRTGLLAQRLHEYLAERVPTVAEQVHLHAMLLEDYEDAEEVRKRWEAGEDFADLVREVSLDEQTKENGGDIGWFPRGVMIFGFDEELFNLDIGGVSEPLPSEVGFHLIMVSEKAVAREIEEEPLQILKSKALDTWLLQERQYHEIKYNFNSEINAWINWQLSKSQPEQQ